MARVKVRYNPYHLKTDIKIDGKDLTEKDSILQYVKDRRLQEWIGDFPKKLKEECNTKNFEIKFYGLELDWDDFQDSFNEAVSDNIIDPAKLEFISKKKAEDIERKIIEIFKDIQNGPIDDFKVPKLTESFKNLQEEIFPINVIATMSAGKSTLINALLSNKLMPSKNEACTATITRITDNGNPNFNAIVYDENGNVIDNIKNLDIETMEKLNSNKAVSEIIVEGNIPFLDSKDTRLMLVDTPGPNNSQNLSHKDTTESIIKSDSNNLILYVLNGTQLQVTDDDNLLKNISEEIKQGGKQARDRFLFVINKMDSYHPEEENIEETIESVKQYLVKHGINDPQIFPCSAFTALNLRTELKDIDIDNLTQKQKRTLSSSAQDTIPLVDKFIVHESMFLEKYSTISSTVKKEIEKELETAKKENDTKTEALIHCGIFSIEKAIKYYIKKYSKTKKIKDLVETFQSILSQKAIIEDIKAKISENQKLEKSFEDRLKAIQQQIKDGKEAQKFKDKINEFNPIKNIEKKLEDIKKQTLDNIVTVFNGHNNTLSNEKEVKELVEKFSDTAIKYIAEMVVKIKNIIQSEIVEVGKKILSEYQNQINSFDEKDKDNQKFDFSTLNIIKDKLQELQKNIKTKFSNEFVKEVIDETGSYEDKKVLVMWHRLIPLDEIKKYIDSAKKNIEKSKTGSYKTSYSYIDQQNLNNLKKLENFYKNGDRVNIDDKTYIISKNKNNKNKEIKVDNRQIYKRTIIEKNTERTSLKRNTEEVGFFANICNWLSTVNPESDETKEVTCYYIECLYEYQDKEQKNFEFVYNVVCDYDVNLSYMSTPVENFDLTTISIREEFYVENEYSQLIEKNKNKDSYWTKIIKEFKAKISDIQLKCISKLCSDLEFGIASVLMYSQEQTDKMKNQFVGMLDNLNNMILKEKSKELNSCASEKEKQEKEMTRNQKILKWVEDNQKEIDETLKV